jgi:hypothetical protein
MTRRKASFLQGPTASKYSLPAEDHRLNQAGLLIGDPTTAGKPLQVRPGVLVGPFSPGAVAVTTGGVNVSPFHAVVQGTVNGTQGPYLVTSDAVEFRAVTAASASEFRRGYVLVHLYDQVSGIDVKDDWDIEVVYGPNAATAGAATLPARTANAAILKEFAVSNTGVITLVAASGEFTGPRGGILPVLVDGANVPGHDGAAPSYDGHYRHNPTSGLQVGAAGVWGPVVSLPTYVVPTFLASWDQYDLGGPYGELLRLWRNTSNTVRLQGIFRNVGASVPSGATVNPFTIPVGYRPPTGLSVIRTVVGSPGGAAVTPQAHRIDITSGGAVTIYSGSAVAINSGWVVDCSWRTVNT